MLINKEEIKSKKARLEQIKAELKLELFGIDDVIDRVVDSIQTWFLLPDAITHPIIINLFGMTGTGKTQLVRSLVEKLGFNNKFVEVQMDGAINSTRNYMLLSDLMEDSNISEREPGIILLDEFQRFRTIDEQGKEIKVTKFADVWQLLSDGKFGMNIDSINQILDYINYSNYMKDSMNMWELEANMEKDEETIEKEKKQKAQRDALHKERKFKVYPNEAKKIKKVFRLSESITEIMQWTDEKLNEVQQNFVNFQDVDPTDYSKCLIFVCGNLDEAFDISKTVEDSDTDADIFHEVTKRISTSDIKAVLRKRFKPEQIARLGNNILIYPSLNRLAYTQIIKSACQKYINNIKDVSNINFTIKDNLYKEIYANSVYPSQGTRPVFSSIHKIFGSPLSDAVLWALENDINDISLDLDVEKFSLICDNGSIQKEIKVELDIQSQKNKNSLDFKTLVAVHEAGHAVIHAVLLKLCPQEIAINLASFNGGFVVHKNRKVRTRKDLLSSVAISMAGICAEEIVFGPEFRSAGCSSDLSNATITASSYVRRHGFDGTLAYIQNTPSNDFIEDNFDVSNAAIETILKEAKVQVSQLITSNIDFFKETITTLLAKNSMNEASYFEIAKKYVSDIEFGEKELTVDYNSFAKKFLEN